MVGHENVQPLLFLPPVDGGYSLDLHRETQASVGISREGRIVAVGDTTFLGIIIPASSTIAYVASG